MSTIIAVIWASHIFILKRDCVRLFVVVVYKLVCDVVLLVMYCMCIMCGEMIYVIVRTCLLTVYCDKHVSRIVLTSLYSGNE